LDPRDSSEAAAAVLPGIDQLLSAKNEDVRQAAASLAGALKLTPAEEKLARLVRDDDEETEVRVEALLALEAIESAQLDGAVLAAVDSKESALRSEGRRLLAKISPADALPVLTEV